MKQQYARLPEPKQHNGALMYKKKRKKKKKRGNHKDLAQRLPSQTVFMITIGGALIEWLLPVSVSVIPPDIEMLVSVLVVFTLPLNLTPSNIMRPSRAAFVAGLRNPSWISSNPRPRVSGMKTASMMSVKRDRPPKKK